MLCVDSSYIKLGIIYHVFFAVILCDCIINACINAYEHQRSRSLFDLCPRSLRFILSNICSHQSNFMWSSELSCKGPTLFKWCGSHDQDGCHAHIWLNPFKKCLLWDQMAKNGDSWMTFNFLFLQKGQISLLEKSLESSSVLRWAMQDHWSSG